MVPNSADTVVRKGTIKTIRNTRKHIDPHFNKPTTQIGIKTIVEAAGLTTTQKEEIYALCIPTFGEEKLERLQKPEEKRKTEGLRLEIGSIYYEHFQGKGEEWEQKTITKLVQRAHSN